MEERYCSNLAVELGGLRKLDASESRSKWNVREDPTTILRANPIKTANPIE
jgi:hypothetical protein